MLKKLFTLTFILLSCSFAYSQEETETEPETTPKDEENQKSNKVYSATGGEVIFSFVDFDVDVNAPKNPMRFTLFFHTTYHWNFDLNSRVGIYSGLELKNIGFIARYNNTLVTRTKHRTYNLGVPLAIKIGDMKKGYLFAGGAAELAFHYKEKTFQGKRKVDKFGTWFDSDRTNLFLPAAFVGFKTKSSVTFKFQYYFTSLLNTNFTELDEPTQLNVKPYSNLGGNVFFFSINFITKDKKKTKDVIKKRPETTTTRYTKL